MPDMYEAIANKTVQEGLATNFRGYINQLEDLSSKIETLTLAVRDKNRDLFGPQPENPKTGALDVVDPPGYNSRMQVRLSDLREKVSQLEAEISVLVTI